jgi:hypothetical protein
VGSFTPLLLYPRGENSWYPLRRRLSRIQKQSERCGIEKRVFFSFFFFPPLSPVVGIETVRPVSRAFLLCVEGDEYFDSMNVDFDTVIDLSFLQ